MAKTLRFKRAALALATLGLAAGSALSLATLGVLQVPQELEVPVEVTRGGVLPVRDQLYVAVPRTYHHKAVLELILKGDARARLITSEENYNNLKDRPPLTIDRIEPTEYSVTFRDDLGNEVVINGVREDDDEAELIIMAMYLMLDDED
ncbi:MAG: hypothetical protein RPU52_00415 [Candidatus Sedimenticola sp. (ex Thyasira tokunagai)]